MRIMKELFSVNAVSRLSNAQRAVIFRAMTIKRLQLAHAAVRTLLFFLFFLFSTFNERSNIRSLSKASV